MPYTTHLCLKHKSHKLSKSKFKFFKKQFHNLCTCFACSKSIHHQDSSRFEDIQGEPYTKKITNTTSPKIFSYAELYIATRGFSDDELLGRGGFGRVYRAALPSDDTTVAVKCVLNNDNYDFEKTFAAELVAVAQLRHRNLVRLIGWCAHENQLLLVYDYMPNRSLDRLLFSPFTESAPILSFERRRNIASGLAAALFYLHEQLDTQIIHRDVKTSNVMLDSNFNARLGDFGLARWLEHNQLGFSIGSYKNGNGGNYQFRLTDRSKIGGTIGYLPPESFQKKRLATAKSDVFSFGIVVLEIATGRRAVDLTYKEEEIIMVDWVRKLSDEGDILRAVDHKLPDGTYKLLEIERLLHIGLICTLHDPQSRPTMKWVAENLSNGSKLPNLPNFQSHPLYISLSSSSNSNTTTTATTASTDSTGSNFQSANGSTIFLTAVSSDETSGGFSSGDSIKRPSLKQFLTTVSSEETSGGFSSGDSIKRRPSFKQFLNVDTPRQISYKEIVAITDNFSESQMVAELDFGTGYHGYLENRIHVLVKRLGMKTCPALRTRFTNELKNLGRLRHRHLVQLRGWCTEHGEMLVVYDYTCSGLLSHYLFHDKRSVLSWNHRYRIVKSLASAILYLHEEWDEQVIHRNITSSAVFLDSDMNPKLGCFALAEFLSRNEHGEHVANLKSSGVMGIFGYMSPEYMESGEATTMADVYSFGVVVLEVVSGLMAVDFRWSESLLLKKVNGFEEMGRPLDEIVDVRLDGGYDGEELRRLVKLGMACTCMDSGSRPSMRQIVSILDGNDEELSKLGCRKQRKEEWDMKYDSVLNSVRRIKALGIQ